jgi:hypothetical protein
MHRTFRAILLLTLSLCACSPSGPSLEAIPPTEAASIPAAETVPPTDQLFPPLTSEVLPPPKLQATLSTPHIDQGPDGAATEAPSRPQDCGYQWAYQDMPELAASFQSSIQELQPGAQASLFAFGENCVRADGSSSFIPMETDFNITLQVTDLANEADLGEWIVKVVQIIENIPTEEIVGPRPGRVAIAFQSGEEKGNISFYINQYRDLPAGLSNAEIYQALKNLQ